MSRKRPTPDVQRQRRARPLSPLVILERLERELANALAREAGRVVLMLRVAVLERSTGGLALAYTNRVPPGALLALDDATRAEAATALRNLADELES